ncbi:MAG: hypothetical protein K0S80_4619, partial [Neobacillus sp.]|nr:hypothetical protein [Neobacillus sp.]
CQSITKLHTRKKIAKIKPNPKLLTMLTSLRKDSIILQNVYHQANGNQF